MRLSSTIYKTAYFLGITHLFLRLGRSRPVTVCYHNVIPDHLFDDSVHLGVSLTESEFQQQLELLSAKYSIVTALDEPGSCVLTFDDFNRNNYAVVFPQLRKRGLNAYFFAPLSKIAGELHWVDKLSAWISYAPAGTYEIAKGLTLTLNDDTRAACWNQTWDFAIENYAHKDELLAEMDRRFPMAGLPIDGELHNLRFGNITGEEISELKAAGNFIGAHSTMHDVLAKFSDDAALMRDFAACAAEIGGVFNTTVYCYPFGGEPEVGSRVIKACQAAGFTSAFLNIDGEDRSPYARTRVYLGRAVTPWEVYAKTSGLDRWLRRWWLRLRSRKAPVYGDAATT